MGQQCRAKSKASGEQCKRWATPGKNVCVIHGSRAGRKPKSFRYARALENNPLLKANFDFQLQCGSDVFDVSQELALMRARLGAYMEGGEADIRVVNDITRDLVRGVQKNQELLIKRQNLVKKSDAEAMLKSVVEEIVKFVPEEQKPACFEAITRRLSGAKDPAAELAAENVIPGEYGEEDDASDEELEEANEE